MEQFFWLLVDSNKLTCVGPGMQDRTLSMFSVVTSTSSTARRTSPGKEEQHVSVLHLFQTVKDDQS